MATLTQSQCHSVSDTTYARFQKGFLSDSVSGFAFDLPLSNKKTQSYLLRMTSLYVAGALKLSLIIVLTVSSVYFSCLSVRPLFTPPVVKTPALPQTIP